MAWVVWLVACSLESKSIGDPIDASSDSGSEASTSTDSPTSASSDTASETATETGTDTGNPAEQCPGNPLWGCTTPFTGGWPCGETPYDDLDENCCPRPTCADDEDCAADESCQPVATDGFGCTDFPGPDDVLECVCGANPTGGRRICVPDDGIDPSFCENYLDEGSCEGAAEVPYDDQHAYYCVWADVYRATVQDDGTCDPELAVEQRCVTATHNFMGGDPGCSSRDCSVGDTPIETGAARLTGEFYVEYISLTQYFCGSEQGLAGEEWIACDDPSFGSCACDCA